jgi:hypothetical protein
MENNETQRVRTDIGVVGEYHNWTLNSKGGIIPFIHLVPLLCMTDVILFRTVCFFLFPTRLCLVLAFKCLKGTKAECSLLATPEGRFQHQAYIPLCLIQ